jgi:hypothetical protein
LTPLYNVFHLLFFCKHTIILQLDKKSWQLITQPPLINSPTMFVA